MRMFVCFIVKAIAVETIQQIKERD